MHFQPIEDDDVYLAQGGGGEYHHEAPVAAYDALDDVFGAGDEEEVLPVASLDGADVSSHPSDMHRLETEHTSAGYREGITVAKERTVQAGFDEGFSLGGTIGLMAGQLLGTLEGIEEAVRNQSDAEAAAGAGKLLAEAKEELSAAKIFSPEFWAPDGNWSYDVNKPEAGDEVLFADVAREHPLIRKWTSIVDEQIGVWKIDRSVMDDEDGPRAEMVADEPPISIAAPTTTTSSRKPLDW